MNRTLAVSAILMLTGCTSAGTLTPAAQSAVVAACKVDAQLQPVLVTLAPAAGAQVAAVATIDAQLAHPLVVAACAAVGGLPSVVVVTPAVPAL